MSLLLFWSSAPVAITVQRRRPMVVPRTTAVVTIADEAWSNARDVAAGDIAVGWRINGVGRASFRLPAKTAHLLGWSDLKGRWVWLPMGPLGVWGGIIEDDPGDLADGTVELSCADFGSLLDHAITPRTYRQLTSTPGALIGRAIRDTALDGPLWFDSVTVDEGGAAVTLEHRGDPLGRVVQSLATNAGGLWRVAVGDDATIDFSYETDFSDTRTDLILWEGYNVVAGSVRPSISQVVNDLLAVANDRDWQQAGAARVVDGPSVRDYGRRQGSKRYAGHTRRSSLETVARADLDRLALPTSAISIDVPITDRATMELREGQLVTLASATTSTMLDFEVAARAYDANRGVVTYVGTAQEQDG